MKTDNYATVADTEELIRIGKLPTALLLAGHLEKTMQSPLHGKAADDGKRDDPCGKAPRARMIRGWMGKRIK